MKQTTIFSYLANLSGWQPITQQHDGDILLQCREAGGGGDCMYHSIAACLADSRTFKQLRLIAASAVTTGVFSTL